MNSRVLSAFVLALVMLQSGASARELPDVGGLRLGMTATQVFQTLRAQDKAYRVFQKPCLKDYIAEHRKVVAIEGPGHCVQSLNADYAGGDLLVSFSEDLPSRPGVSVVTGIALNYPTDSTLVSTIIRQAGRPSFVDHNHPWIVAVWCTGPPCSGINSVVSNRDAGPMLLVHRGAGLTLNDAAVQTRSDEALYAALTARGIRLQP